MKATLACFIVVAATGCAGLLPTKTVRTHTDWTAYSQVQTVAKHIHAGQSLADLKAIGIDVDRT